MTRHRSRALFAWIASAVLVHAAPIAAQDIAIVGGTVHTVAGAPIENGTVLIRNGRIAAVGLDIAVPDGATRIDATDRIVTPGLFDPASSIGLLEVDLVSDTRDESMADEEDIVTAAFDPVIALNPNSVLLPYARLGGVTTATTGPRGGLIAGQAAVIDLIGTSPADMVAEPAVAMIATYGESGADRAGGARGTAALRLREVLEDARFWARNRAAFDRGEARELSESRLDLEALQPVLAGTMPLVVQVHRASDILGVLRIADEYGIRPVILGGSEAWMVAGELAGRRVPVILKPRTSLPSSFERLGARFDNAALLAAANVPIAFTTFENHRAHEITQEAGNAVRFGLDWDAALAAITRTPAEIYGVDDRYGTIEPGKVANVVVWSGDPLDLSGYPESVVIRGRVVPEWSRQRELYERYETLDGGLPPAYE